MPISVSCDCGARLKVRDEAAGKRVKCPKCQAAIQVPQAESPPEPELQIVDEPAAPPEPAAAPPSRSRPGVGRRPFGAAALSAGPRASRRPDDRPGLRSRATVAWEVCVVIGLLVLALLGSLKELAGGKGGVIGLGLNVLMLVGLFKRTNWAWWLTTILSGVGVAACMVLAGMAPPELKEAASILYIAAAIYGGIIGLLILCRVRGAYLQ